MRNMRLTLKAQKCLYSSLSLHLLFAFICLSLSCRPFFPMGLYQLAGLDFSPQPDFCFHFCFCQRSHFVHFNLRPLPLVFTGREIITYSIRCVHETPFCCVTNPCGVRSPVQKRPRRADILLRREDDTVLPEQGVFPRPIILGAYL